MTTANRIMIEQVYVAKETDTIADVLRLFVEHRISGVPIVSASGEAVGYVSDGDIVRSLARVKPITFDVLTYYNVWIDSTTLEEKLNDVLPRNIMDIASTKIISVSPDTELDDVAAVLARKKIKKVPVLQDGRLVGIISRGDLMRYAMRAQLDKTE